MKKALSAFVFVLFSLIHAQELGKEVSISKNWITSINNNNLSLSNGRIINHTDKSTNRLNLDYYLSSTKYNSSEPGINGILLAQSPINPINKNASISGVSIQNKIDILPQDGTYYQILSLSEYNGSIKDIVGLPRQIVIENGNLQFKKDDDIFSRQSIKQINQTMALTDLEKPIKLNVKSDNSILLEKEWKINIDYKEFMVMLIGGDIVNNTSENSNKLILDVYLAKENLYELKSNFEGVHIAKAPIDGVANSKRLSNASIKTNLRAIPPQGTYYLLLTLSELDESGNPIIKDTKSFKNAITL